MNLVLFLIAFFVIALVQIKIEDKCVQNHIKKMRRARKAIHMKTL